MINIGKPIVTKNDGLARVSCSIEIPNQAAQKWIDYSKSISSSWRVHEDYPPAIWQEDFKLYFEIEEKYMDGLCDDRADGFVVALLYYAMITGSDIISEAPVSSALLHNLNTSLIPKLCRPSEGFKPIEIKAEAVLQPYPSKGYIGTGMSCGVDSIHSLYYYTQEDIQEEYKLTHLTYLNMGSIFHPGSINRGGSIEKFNETVDSLYLEKLRSAKAVADSAGLPLVYIQSNLDRDIYRGGYGFTALYRNAALILATQGLWKTYYNSSSGFPHEYFSPSLRTGSAIYEAILIPALCNDTVKFLIGSAQFTRLEKTEQIADFKIAQDHLDVCFRFNNCGNCSKCYRTLLTLDLLGKLDQYKNVFDVNSFNRNKDKAYGYMLYSSSGPGIDYFAEEIIKKAKAQGRISLKAKLYAVKLRFNRFVFKIIKKFPFILNSKFVQKRRRRFL